MRVRQAWKIVLNAREKNIKYKDKQYDMADKVIHNNNRWNGRHKSKYNRILNSYKKYGNESSLPDIGWEMI